MRFSLQQMANHPFWFGPFALRLVDPVQVNVEVHHEDSWDLLGILMEFSNLPSTVSKRDRLLFVACRQVGLKCVADLQRILH